MFEKYYNKEITTFCYVSLFVVFLFLADEIFYRSYVDKAAFSFAVLCIIMFCCSVFLRP